MPGRSGERRPGTRVLLPVDEPRRRKRTPRSVLIAALVVTASSLALIVVAAASGDHSPQRGASTAAGAAPPGGMRIVDGVPVGYPHTRAGAEAAAVNYQLARTRPAYFTEPATRHKILAVMMAPQALTEQIRSDDDQTARVVARLGLGAGDGTSGRFIARAAPLGTRITSYTELAANVDVWMAEVAGVVDPSSVLPPSASWSTYGLTLVWLGDWKIAALSAASGPVPLAAGQDPTPVQDWQQVEGSFDAPPPLP